MNVLCDSKNMYTSIQNQVQKYVVAYVLPGYTFLISKKCVVAIFSSEHNT